MRRKLPRHSSATLLQLLGAQLGQLLRELREDKASYFGHLTSPGDRPLFTGCRYREWALLTMDRLVRELSSVLYWDLPRKTG